MAPTSFRGMRASSIALLIQPCVCFAMAGHTGDLGEASGNKEGFVGVHFLASGTRQVYKFLPGCGRSLIDLTGSSLWESNGSSQMTGTAPNACPTVCWCGLLSTPRKKPSLSGPLTFLPLVSNSNLCPHNHLFQPSLYSGSP